MSQRGAGEQLEDLVAGAVAVAVVDDLEVVEVADDHRHRRALRSARAQLDVEALLEAAAVEQAGERVGAGGVGEALR